MIFVEDYATPKNRPVRTSALVNYHPGPGRGRGGGWVGAKPSIKIPQLGRQTAGSIQAFSEGRSLVKNLNATTNTSGLTGNAPLQSLHPFVKV